MQDILSSIEQAQIQMHSKDAVPAAPVAPSTVPDAQLAPLNESEKYWSKELKRRFNSWLEVNKPPKLERELIVAIINFAIQEESEKAPNCEDCDERRHADEPCYNEGYS
jgi:hypothetical protein